MPLAFLLAVVHVQAQTVPLTLLRNGVAQTVGGSSTRTIALSTVRPIGLRTIPAALTYTLYGVLKLEGLRFFVILGTQGKVRKLFVDADSQGDLAGDPPATWREKIGEASAGGRAEVRIPFSGHRAAVDVVLIQSGAKQLTVIPDYGFAGQLMLGSHEVPFVFTDGGSLESGSPAGGILAFDRADDGRFSVAAEQYAADKPFTIYGSSMILHSVSLRNADATFMPGENVPEIPMPRLLTVGRQAPSFTAPLLGGGSVNFPADFSGRVVLVYAWAAGSAPSLAWLSRVKQVYEANKARNFTVLGICLDQTSQLAAAKATAVQMPWQTVFDGKSWRGEVAKTLNLAALPFLLLVDGTTGKIVGTMSDIAMDKLAAAVQSALIGP